MKIFIKSVLEDHSDEALCSEELSTSISKAPKIPPSTRKASKKHRYIAAKSRKPYKILTDLQMVLSDNEPTMPHSQAMGQHFEWIEWNENASKCCNLVLEKYCTAFKLKRRNTTFRLYNELYVQTLTDLAY